MIISNTCKYAIRAVVYIAMNQSETKKIGIKEIASELELPSPFLSKILQQLAKRKILGSIKGPNGGFFIENKAENLTIYQIVEVIDGADVFNDCFMGLNMCKNNVKVKEYCPAHAYSEPIRANFKKMFLDLSVAKFAEELEANSDFIKL